MDCNCKKLFVTIDNQSLCFFRQDGSDDTADYNFQMFLEALTFHTLVLKPKNALENYVIFFTATNLVF